jgi:hypothetical protein
MHVSEYLLKLASMTGVSVDDENLKNLVANEDLQNIEINDELANQINGKLLTIDSSKNDSDLNKHFRATILNGLDAEMTTLMTDLELPDDVRNELMAETSSFKRATLLTKKVAELEKAKAGKSEGDKSTLQTEIDKLNAQILDLNTAKDTEIANINKQWESRFLDQSMTTMLSGYDYALPTSKDISLMTAKTLLNKAINDKGLQVVNDDNGSLKLVNSADGLDYFENNQKVSVSDFADKLLTEHKLLKTNNGDGSNGTSNPIVPQGGTTQPATTSNKMMGAVEQMIAEAEGK